MLRAAVFCACVNLLWAITGCSSPASVTDPATEQLSALWTEGQSRLLDQNERWIADGEPPIPGDVRSVPYRSFHFVAHGEPIYLDGQRVGGYFNPNSRTIHYHEPVMRDSLPHEAGHAILYELKDPRWPCVFHPDCR